MVGYRVAFDAIEWESPLPGVRHKVHRVGTQVLRLVEYAHEMEPHWCDRGHLGYLIEGRFEIEFANGLWVFQAGDGVTIPNGHENRHRARVLTDVVRAVFVEDA